jgi:hypothetical protein
MTININSKNMTENIDEIGGNKLLLILGSRLNKLGNSILNLGKRYTEKGTKTIISNPSCKLINPFTLIINFTVDNNTKYQLVLQGDYKNKYKEHQDSENPITNNEMFILIKSHTKEWYLKD